MDPIADDPDIKRAARLAASLPGVELSTWYGTPGAQGRRQGDSRGSRRPGFWSCSARSRPRQHLFATAPEIFFETDHYKGWPALLVRMEAIDDATLAHRIEVAWLEKAPAKLVKAWSPQHVL